MLLCKTGVIPRPNNAKVTSCYVGSIFNGNGRIAITLCSADTIFSTGSDSCFVNHQFIS